MSKVLDSKKVAKDVEELVNARGDYEVLAFGLDKDIEDDYTGNARFVLIAQGGRKYWGVAEFLHGVPFMASIIGRVDK